MRKIIKKHFHFCNKCAMIRITRESKFGLLISDRYYIGGIKGRKCDHEWELRGIQKC